MTILASLLSFPTPLTTKIRHQPIAIRTPFKSAKMIIYHKILANWTRFASAGPAAATTNPLAATMVSRCPIYYHQITTPIMASSFITLMDCLPS